MRLTVALKAALLNAMVAMFGLGLTQAETASPLGALLVATVAPPLMLITMARAVRDLDPERADAAERRAARLALVLCVVPLVVLLGLVRQLTGHLLPR
jgi:fructose-specific phosphotransferase system IIC component